MENHVTKNEFNMRSLEVDKKFDELREDLTSDIRAVGALVEENAHTLQAIAEMLGGSLKKDTTRDERIENNTENIKRHDIKIGVLQDKVS